MADKQDNAISLKALVDKENNRVIYVESDADFVDVLFSFLTIPMGTIIGLSRNYPSAMGIGCMNNLYEGVEKFDERHLQTEACKVMLLTPRNGAETHCNNLKLKIEPGEPTRYFFCKSCKLLSPFRNMVCGCGSIMTSEQDLKKSNNKSFAARDGGVFVKEVTRFIISDDFQVTPLSFEASLSLFSKLGIMDGNTVEEKAFNIGKDEVLNLLACSLVSMTPLSETLLKEKPAQELSKKNYSQGSSVQSKIEGDATNQDGKICVKLIVSKTRKLVCFAEARVDFVNLLFSFLTVPLGHVLKEMQVGSLKSCIDHLYNSVRDLDEQYFKSDCHQEMLTSPKLAPGFSYENQPLGIEEAAHQPYYLKNESRCAGYGGHFYSVEILTTDSGELALRVMDPKSNYMKGEHGMGFVVGPAMFTITDSLIITPISPIMGLSVLNKLQVPLTDIEERIVHVGKEEALRLLVASFVSESALTNAFILKEPKQETSILKEPKQETSILKEPKQEL